LQVLQTVGLEQIEQLLGQEERQAPFTGIFPFTQVRQLVEDEQLEQPDGQGEQVKAEFK
jgi:hypothetical protein